MAHRLSNSVALSSALAAVLIALQQTTHVLPGSGDSFGLERERCYGVARAGKNDCGTAQHACAARASHDAQRDEWLMLPSGTCDRVVGGTVRPPSV